MVAFATIADMPRQFTPASFRSRRRRIKAERQVARNKLPGSFRIMAGAIRMLAAHWEVYGGILLIYLVLNVVLIGGVSSGTDLSQAADDIADVFTGQFGKLTAGFTLFGVLLQSGSTVASGVSSAYQTVLIIVVSLAVIWSLRQFYAGNAIRVRDAFYNAPYPLVVVLLVLLVVLFQLLPATVGLFIFNGVVMSQLVTAVWQQLLVSAACLALVVWSFYMLCASLFALYIATLPDMTPSKALRSAKEIVRHRRGMVLLKVLFLPLALFVVAAAIMTPVAVLLTIAAAPVWLLLTTLALPVVHSYMYALYRELIAT